VARGGGRYSCFSYRPVPAGLKNILTLKFMGVLPGKEVAKYVESYVKINPAGVDIAPKKIFYIEEPEYIIIEDERRGFFKGKFYDIKEYLKEVEPKGDYWELEKGIYYVVFPRVSIPKNCVGFAYPRSTFNRLGLIKVQTAVFDPGYIGEFQQTWYFPFRAKIKKDVAWVQLVLIRLEGEGEYSGKYQLESY